MSTDLSAAAAELLEQARTASSGRAARPIFTSPVLKAVVIALREGSALAEHRGPAAATLQCLQGRARLWSGEDEWVLDTGGFVSVPQEKHGVDALSDCVILLTVAAGQAPEPVEVTIG